MTRCDELNLEIVLHAAESLPDSRLAEIASHVESCNNCQDRLAELAASQGEWQEVVTRLSPKELSAEIYTESLVAARRWQRPTDWSNAMAKTLLSPPSHPELLGRLGRYDIERWIGSGGMGIVFKAHDTELNRPVAVKLLAPYLAESGPARSRFAREARAAAAVVDDHVVPIYNVESKYDEVPFLVMQYVAGGSLQQRIDRDGPLAVAETLRIGLQVAKGLAAAHAQGLIHRDVKPSNILLDEGVERALLADFGLARAEHEASLTRSGLHPGTPHYMSPEQVGGEAIDGRSDLFSLGCVLYALCTGHPPFRAESSYAVMRRITDDSPRPIRQINAEVPAWLEGIIFKLLSKTREDRFASAGELAELLEDCLAHIQHPTTTSLPRAVECLVSDGRRQPPWKKWLVLGAATFAFVFLGVLFILETDKGTLTVESEADNVPIRIVQEHHLVEKLVVNREGTKLRLRGGQYALEMDVADGHYVIDDDSVTIRRGETQIAKIRYSAKEEVRPLTDQGPLDAAVREFNNLHPADAQGRPQPPLTGSEVIAALLWKRDNGELSDDVIKALWLQPNHEELLIPAGWQLTGGMVRQPCDLGIMHTWQVNLNTGGLTDPISIRRTAIGLASPTIKQLAPSTRDSLAPLGTAVEQFNVAQEELEDANLLDQSLPLTVEEVLAAIALSESVAIERRHQMVHSGKFSWDVRFERVTSRMNTVGEVFAVDAIHMHIRDANEPKSMTTLVIRDRFIKLDFQNPAATFWGRPARNGLQAGARLVPAQQSYSRGQIVNIEFLYRNVLSKETSATLPPVFQFGNVRGIRLVRVDFVHPKWLDGSVTTSIGSEPLVVHGHQMQICFNENEAITEGVNLKAITRPTAHHYVRFKVPNLGKDATDQPLETGRGLHFSIEPLTPPKVLPIYRAHYYQHWGAHVPGHQLPPKSTPDSSYTDPFMLGMSLRPAEKSRIPAYFAGGFEVAKVAPHSPAEKAGIEEGDIVLAWEGHQIYGGHPSKDFFQTASANRQLKEYQERFKKRGRAIGMNSGGTKFVLLDHRTGEVIDIAPWYGGAANGDWTKTQIVERQLQRKQHRSTD